MPSSKSCRKNKPPLPQSKILSIRPNCVCWGYGRKSNRLLNLMDGREVCVCYFVQILGQKQPKISRHLAYLRRVGVVAGAPRG